MATDNIVSWEGRNQYAIPHIDPSIIGSALTTLSTAIIMEFTENEFSRKIVAIVQALMHVGLNQMPAIFLEFEKISS